MQVHVIVRVHVVERQPRGGEGLELRADFGAKLRTRAGAKEKAHARARGIVEKGAVGAHQIGDFPRG